MKVLFSSTWLSNFEVPYLKSEEAVPFRTRDRGPPLSSTAIYYRLSIQSQCSIISQKCTFLLSDLYLRKTTLPMGAYHRQQPLTTLYNQVQTISYARFFIYTPIHYWIIVLCSTKGAQFAIDINIFVTDSPHAATCYRCTVSTLSQYQYPLDTNRNIRSSDQRLLLPLYRFDFSLKLVLIVGHLDIYALSQIEIFLYPSLL